MRVPETTRDEVILDIVRHGIDGHERNEGRRGARMEFEKLGLPSLGLLAERIICYTKTLPMGRNWLRGYMDEWRSILDANGIAWK